MKKIIFILTSLLVLAGSGCKKERWLRVYNAGVFEDSINVTGWEVNEDVVEIGDLYYPWQGEDSIDYSWGPFWVEGMGWNDTTRRIPLEVNGKTVGLAIYLSEDIKASYDPNDIITVNFKDYDQDHLGEALATIEKFPNLIGIGIPLDARRGFRELDYVPINSRRLYITLDHAVDAHLDTLRKYHNIRAISVLGDSITTMGLHYLFRFKDLKKITVCELKRNLEIERILL